MIDIGGERDHNSINVTVNDTSMISVDLKKDTTALEKDELDEGEIIIAKMHPMRELFLWDVFPMFACCLKKC